MIFLLLLIDLVVLKAVLAQVFSLEPFHYLFLGQTRYLSLDHLHLMNHDHCPPHRPNQILLPLLVQPKAALVDFGY
tara:strand:+ start:3096 stop:3323 length:228 start_codon:yes stop_codon:yes gene_type:complete